MAVDERQFDEIMTLLRDMNSRLALMEGNIPTQREKRLYRYSLGGTAPTGAASATGDISQMIKQIVSNVSVTNMDKLVGTTDMGAHTGSATGSLGEKLQDIKDNLSGGQNIHMISTLSPASVGLEGFNITGTAPGPAAWPSANLAIYTPFAVVESFTVRKMLVINGATVSGNIDVGIYNSAGTKQVSSGSTAQAGASAPQIFDVGDTTLTAGDYFFAVAMDNTTGTLYRWAPGGAWQNKVMGVVEEATAFALPTTATFAASTRGYVPIVAITNIAAAM